MNFFRRNSSRSADTRSANFDMLRSGLEVEVQRPAVVAITATTKTDAPEVAARGLAESLANTGYPTLYIDASSGNQTIANPNKGMTIDEIKQLVVTRSAMSKLVEIDLTDATMQRTTSQRDVQSTLETFRSQFDYVVISTETGVLTSFATSIVTGADAVLVTVKTGRRENRVDTKLADALNRLGTRFLGILAVDALLENGAPATFRDNVVRRGQPVHVEKEFTRREMAERLT